MNEKWNKNRIKTEQNEIKKTQSPNSGMSKNEQQNLLSIFLLELSEIAETDCTGFIIQTKFCIDTIDSIRVFKNDFR